MHQAEVAGAIAGAGVVERFFRSWQARRAVRRLQDLDDHMLRDIGVRREDIRWASRLPLTVNVALALEDRQLARLAKETRHAE